jgi:hypothetical protein
VAVSVLQIVTNALAGLSVLLPGEPLKDADAEYCRGQLNTILDNWSAERQAAYTATFTTFTTTPGLQPHTIGPTGTWVTATRPIAIDGLARSIGTGLWTPIPVTSDPAWWQAQTSVVSGTPTRAFYTPDEPNGSLYFTPSVDGALAMRAQLRMVIGAVLLTDMLTLPNGYEGALTLTLQEAVADAFHAVLTPSQIQRAGQARGRAFGNNLHVPVLVVRGLPGQGTGRHYDYRSGQCF